MSEPLPEAVRTRVVDLASQALGALEPDRLPPSLRRVASFAPARRARLAGSQIAAVLAQDDDFRERVATQVRAEVSDLARALEDGVEVGAADPVDVAAVAYLLRPDGWTEIVSRSVAALGRADETGETGSAEGERLARRLESATEQLKDQRQRHREQLAEMKARNTDLRQKLGESRARLRAAEELARQSVAAADEAVSAAAARASEQDAELRRLRGRAEQLERDLAAVRRAERLERGAGTMRARLLLDTLLDTASGLRRELNLPAVDGVPADGVQAHLAEQGSRSSSGQGSMAADDPALLDQLLMLPRVHLVVDGYNVTKSTWPELSLEQQRDRLLGGLAPLAARSGAELTVVFDAALTADRPLVNRPRGVRVLYSPPGVIADDVIRELVAAEPRGRPLVVVSSDQEVVRDVTRAGARTAAAAALARLLARS